MLWTYDDATYEIVSMYLVPVDAWTYELTGLQNRAGLAVTIPDATPDDDPFTPTSSDHAHVDTTEGQLPWPVLSRFMQFVAASGDIADDEPGQTVTGDLSSSHNRWQFADRQFEADSYHDGERDCWCYELYETDAETTQNLYIAVRITDRHPADGPFLPDVAERVTFTSYGSLCLPWLVFRHFLNAIEASGDILYDGTAAQ